ncbi:MAG: 50S ribosomal protein L1, partial [Thiogranum sp.]
MAKLSKRAKLIVEKIERGKLYPVEEALALLSEVASPKF